MDNIFYVYVWYKNNIPVYVGKGKGRRAYRNKDVDVEIVRYNLTEQQAFDLEKALISEYGRADLNEGSLWNLTNGGGINFSTLYWDGSILKAKHLSASICVFFSSVIYILCHLYSILSIHFLA